ncbi:odorant receptor 46a-like [Chelonus insularis]|uniref:odorant receptor 46a-like n=1 Tax=Chelonus insularis TaxID=460826 RepID=UPI00158E221B|nr:odorant receptor 46a-like [Chelonus insularis]
MSVLPHNLALFKLIGLWRPVDWSSGWKYLCYNVYSLIVVITIFSSVFTEIVKLISSYENLDTFLTSATVLITMAADCVKITNMLSKRENILKMIQTLINNPCLPRNSEEKLIQNKYDRIIRFRSLANITLIAATVLYFTIESLFRDIPQQKLPYNAWYPMSLSIYANYLLAWIHQNLAHIYGALITADYDTFVPAFMLQSCAKFDILSYRLSNICCKIQNNLEQPGCNNKKEFCKYTNDTFSSVILLQFSVSTGVICVTVYSLSQTAVSDPFFPMLISYLACMLVQLFLYCYAGTEVTLKSADVAEAIYCNVDWWLTSIAVQKKLLFMMLRSTKLVTYTCGKIFDLSIESYKNVNYNL